MCKVLISHVFSCLCRMNVSDVLLCRTTDVLNVSVVLLKFGQKLK